MAHFDEARSLRTYIFCDFDATDDMAHRTFHVSLAHTYEGCTALVSIDEQVAQFKYTFVQGSCTAMAVHSIGLPCRFSAMQASLMHRLGCRPYIADMQRETDMQRATR